VLKDDLKPLEQLIQCLARDAINIQLLWDEARDRDGEQFSALLSQVRPDLWDVLFPLSPARLFMEKFQIATSIRIGLERERGFEIKAVPINLAFSLRYAVKAEIESSICFTVEQVPAANIIAKKGAK
jgi:hypothetical protein